MKLPWRHRTDNRDAALDDEIRAHLEMAVADRIARGESPDAARASARREFGNIGHVKEVTREMWGGLWIERLIQDLTYAVRSLARTPGFAAVVVLTLALGIGANTAMFTVVNGVLLRPLPFRDADQLFLVSHQTMHGPTAGPPTMLERQYPAYRSATRAFQSTAAYNVFPTTLLGAGSPERVATASVTAGFLAVLGMRPSHGRPFTTEEEATGSANVVIIGDALWRDRFAGDSTVLGRSVSVEGRQRTIVGIMPPGFEFPNGAQVWFPYVVEVDPGRNVLRPVVGRLAPGASQRQALAELEAFAQTLERDTPADRVEHAVNAITPLREHLIGNVRRSLLLFSGAVAFVLLIACANVANLLLMRAATRQHEIGVRVALGAGRARLVQQLVTESLVVACIGGIVGLGIALAGVRGLLAVAPLGLLPRADQIHVDASVLGVTAVLTLFAGLGFGLAPALHATRRDIRASLSSGSRALISGKPGLRNALVVAEFALALVLLAGAGLMVRSFMRLRSADLGFRPSNLVTFTVDLPRNAYPTVESLHQFQEHASTEVGRLPGVTAVAAVNWRPLDRTLVTGDFALADGRALPPGYMVLKPCVTANYFSVMGIPVREGRAFSELDVAGAPAAVIVSRLVADQFWPNGGAIGQRMTMVDNPKPADWMTIVGVVDDIRQEGVTKNRMAAVYQALPQVRRDVWLTHLTFVGRIDGDPAPVIRAVRTVLHAIDPAQPVESITTMQSVVASTIAEPLFQTRLLGLFSAFAVMLAAIGIYGVLAFAVTERTREIGIRIALGAAPGRVVHMIVRRTLALAIPGMALGTLASVLMTRVLGQLLFEVTPTDPATFAVVEVVLVVVAMLASVIPARRAGRIDPLTSLRGE